MSPVITAATLLPLTVALTNFLRMLLSPLKVKVSVIRLTTAKSFSVWGMLALLLNTNVLVPVPLNSLFLMIEL